MKEEFLHYVWRTKSFINTDFKSVTDHSISILNFGNYNRGNGPDFKEAEARIGNMHWAGAIEFHLKSSDWYAHGHQLDLAYDSVILHVVWEHDVTVLNTKGIEIPTLVLKEYINQNLISNYESLILEECAIPCVNQLFSVPSIIWTNWVDTLMLERLKEKVDLLNKRLNELTGDWDSLFFEQIAICLGLPLNKHAMQELFNRLPFGILRRYRHDAEKLEALLLGTAGFLEQEFLERYPLVLQKEFRHLQHKHSINPLTKAVWNYRGLRPPSFPTIRLAQLAYFIHHYSDYVNRLLEKDCYKNVFKSLHFETAKYWDNHFLLDKPSTNRKKIVGKSTVETILINAIVPFLFLYGRLQATPRLEELALTIFKKIPAEKNYLIKQWNQIGVFPENAADSQALLQLKKNYCKKKRCTECKIGSYLLQHSTKNLLVKNTASEKEAVHF